MRQALDAYRAIFCDLDGCLIAGGRVLPGAHQLVARAGRRLWVISNNSTDTPQTLSRHLARLGLEVPPDRIVLAGCVAIDMLAARAPRSRTLIFASPNLRDYAEANGLRLEEAAPEFIVLARDRTFDYAALERVVQKLSGGARLIVTNEDASHPGTDGVAVPETGALLAAIKACCPDLTYECFGKPNLTMYRLILARAEAVPADCLAIGDNPATDGLGAASAGLDCVLIGPASNRYPDLGALL